LWYLKWEDDEELICEPADMFGGTDILEEFQVADDELQFELAAENLEAEEEGEAVKTTEQESLDNGDRNGADITIFKAEDWET
jgi:hypothetical protein